MSPSTPEQRRTVRGAAAPDASLLVAYLDLQRLRAAGRGGAGRPHETERQSDPLRHLIDAGAAATLAAGELHPPQRPR